MNREMTATAMTVCVLVPLCNEEGSLPMLGQRLRALHASLPARYTMSCLFVDDGSTDRTRSRIAAAVPPGVRHTVHAHGRNRGIGAAFRTGFRHVSADIVCTIDADCSYPPEDLLCMIERIASGDADVVTASPYHPNGGVEGVGRWRLLLSTSCSRLYRAASPLRLYTYTSIFRAYRGSIVPDLAFLSDGFVSAVEMLLSAAAQGYRVAECPMVLRRRAAGFSKMRILRTVRAHLLLLLRCVFVPVRLGAASTAVVVALEEI